MSVCGIYTANDQESVMATSKRVLLYIEKMSFTSLIIKYFLRNLCSHTYIVNRYVAGGENLHGFCAIG